MPLGRGKEEKQDTGHFSLKNLACKLFIIELQDICVCGGSRGWPKNKTKNTTLYFAFICMVRDVVWFHFQEDSGEVGIPKEAWR